MINFFRKIRKKMADHNRPLKYMRYAIGEIALVVISILIALQINNANENLKLNTIKLSYYNQLTLDLDKEIERITEQNEVVKTRIATYDVYIEKFNDPSDLCLSEVMAGLSVLNFGIFTFEYGVKTIETLQNTGDIKLFSETLRNELIDLNRKQKYLTRIYNRNIDTFQKRFNVVHELGFILPTIG